MPGCHRRRHRCARGSGRRVDTPHTHGTGCSLSSAMATLAAHGLPWPDALTRAKRWLTGALEHAEALHVGRGNGPIDHLHELRPHIDLGRSWSNARWDATASIRAEVDECGFVRGLASGDLDRDAFAWYLGQDLLYLREYARVLARAAALAPTAEEQRFWAAGSVACLAEEATLHQSHVDPTGLEPAPTTWAYTDHLHAARSRRVVRGPGRGDPAVLRALHRHRGPLERHLLAPPTPTPTGSRPMATRRSPRRRPRPRGSRMPPRERHPPPPAVRWRPRTTDPWRWSWRSSTRP